MKRVHGNREVHKAGKTAAEGQQRDSLRADFPYYLGEGSLPLSPSAVKQGHGGALELFRSQLNSR
jgi:hypothetical protein